eukprot:gene29616-35751_t
MEEISRIVSLSHDEGLVLAGLLCHEQAEDCVLQAMLAVDGGDMEHDRELLEISTSMVRYVYLPASDNMPLCASMEGGWLHKAWHVLHWSLRRTCSLSQPSPQPALLDMHESPLSDKTVQALYTLVCSPHFLQRYASKSSSENWQRLVQEALELLCQVLVRLARHRLAAQMCLQLLHSLAAHGAPVFQPVRLDCIRCVLSYCQCQKSNGSVSSAGLLFSAAKTAELLDQAERHLSLLQKSSAAYELWGDAIRMRGGDVRHMSMALCLYAACFRHVGMCANSNAERLANKVQQLANHKDLAGLLSSDVQLDLGLAERNDTCVEFLHDFEILEGPVASPALNLVKLKDSIAQAQSFLEDWSKTQEQLSRHIATVMCNNFVPPKYADKGPSSSSDASSSMPQRSKEYRVRKDDLQSAFQRVIQQSDDEDATACANALSKQKHENPALAASVTNFYKSQQERTSRLADALLRACDTVMFAEVQAPPPPNPVLLATLSKDYLHKDMLMAWLQRKVQELDEEDDKWVADRLAKVAHYPRSLKENMRLYEAYSKLRRDRTAQFAIAIQQTFALATFAVTGEGARNIPPPLPPAAAADTKASLLALLTEEYVHKSALQGEYAHKDAFRVFLKKKMDERNAKEYDEAVAKVSTGNYFVPRNAYSQMSAHLKGKQEGDARWADRIIDEFF